MQHGVRPSRFRASHKNHRSSRPSPPTPRKSILRSTIRGGVPSNSVAWYLRPAQASMRSRRRMNLASRWPGLALAPRAR